jgi:hypothetical protein
MAFSEAVITKSFCLCNFLPLFNCLDGSAISRPVFAITKRTVKFSDRRNFSFLRLLIWLVCSRKHNIPILGRLERWWMNSHYLQGFLFRLIDSSVKCRNPILKRHSVEPGGDVAQLRACQGGYRQVDLPKNLAFCWVLLDRGCAILECRRTCEVSYGRFRVMQCDESSHVSHDYFSRLAKKFLQ